MSRRLSSHNLFSIPNSPCPAHTFDVRWLRAAMTLYVLPRKNASARISANILRYWIRRTCCQCKLILTVIFCKKAFLRTNGLILVLHEAFSSIFPIVSHNGLVELQYVGYELADRNLTSRECQLRGVTYASPLRVRMRLAIYDKGNHDKRN